jgi:hypothetical protein
MIKHNKALWAAAILLSAAGAPSGAFAASVNAGGEAIIVTATSFFLVENMDFGAIVPGPAPGSVTVDATDGTISSSGGVAATAGGHERGRFVGGGSEGQQITLTLSAPPTLDDGNGNTMPMTALTMDGPTVRTIGPDLAFDVYIGGTLDVGANQTPGAYSGTFTLTVDYS